MKYKAVVMGASAGGIGAISAILSSLRKDFLIPMIIVQHISNRSDNYITEYFNKLCNITVKEADDKEEIRPGFVYLAPPNYHLLIEKSFTFSLSTEEKVNYARPSIDVLFETAADAYREKLIGVILTGANSDGSKGMKRIRDYGGITIAQDPSTAEFATMPVATIKSGKVDYILSVKEIGEFLNSISVGGNYIEK